MKNLRYLSIFFSVLLITITSCSKKGNESEKSMQELINVGDTTLVINMANDFMQLLKNNEIEQALDLLYTINAEDDVVKISNEQREQFKQMFEMFPVLTYKLETYYFKSWDDNMIKYETEFYKTDKKVAPNKFTVVFNPIRKGDEWYLSLKDRRY